jgi:hypothetical protein
MLSVGKGAEAAVRNDGVKSNDSHRDGWKPTLITRRAQPDDPGPYDYYEAQRNIVLGKCAKEGERLLSLTLGLIEQEEFSNSGSPIPKLLVPLYRRMLYAHREALKVDNFNDICFLHQDIAEDIVTLRLRRARAQVVQEYYRACTTVVRHLETNFPRELSLKKDWSPPQWMLKDDKIREMLDRTRFEDVYCYLWSRTFHPGAAEELMEQFGGRKYVTVLKSGDWKKEKVERDYVLVIPDYEDMGWRLKLKKRNIQNYLKAFSRIDILERLGKLGPRGQTVYAIGYRIPRRRVPFLKKSAEMIEKLRNFKIT